MREFSVEHDEEVGTTSSVQQDSSTQAPIVKLEGQDAIERRGALREEQQPGLPARVKSTLTQRHLLGDREMTIQRHVRRPKESDRDTKR